MTYYHAKKISISKYGSLHVPDHCQMDSLDGISLGIDDGSDEGDWLGTCVGIEEIDGWGKEWTRIVRFFSALVCQNIS